MKDKLPITTKIYLRAAELIEQGHCKGQQSNCGVDVMNEHATEWCLMGAVKRAGLEMGVPQYDDIWPNEYMEALYMKGIAATWNNHPDTTAAMVAAKLREQAFA